MLTDQKIPLGQYIAAFVEWLTKHGASTFDAIATTLETMIHGVTFALTWFNPLALIGLIALLAHLIQRKWGLTAFVVLSFLLILNLGYWQETMETLAQVLFATLVCVLIGVPLGIVAAHKPLFYTMMRPVLDLMQTVPTFVYLIPTLTLFGLGVVPGLISTVVFAIAAPIRLTYLGIRDVPQELMDAGKAFGCSRRQLLSRIELPH
ncbi:ABC transporter permease subunit, partial [Pseudomonas protegens]